MYKPHLLTSLSLLTSATDYKHSDCGTDSSAATKDFLHTVQSLHSNTSHGSPAACAASLLAHDAGPITVPAIFHIVASTAKKTTSRRRRRRTRCARSTGPTTPTTSDSRSPT